MRLLIRSLASIVLLAACSSSRSSPDPAGSSSAGAGGSAVGGSSSKAGSGGSSAEAGTGGDPSDGGSGGGVTTPCGNAACGASETCYEDTRCCPTPTCDPSYCSDLYTACGIHISCSAPCTDAQICARDNSLAPDTVGTCVPACSVNSSLPSDTCVAFGAAVAFTCDGDDPKHIAAYVAKGCANPLGSTTILCCPADHP